MPAYRYLRLDPGEQPIVLTEPPLNAPENRELTAEILFETFNVPSLYIGMQAILALYASFICERGDQVTSYATDTSLLSALPRLSTTLLTACLASCCSAVSKQPSQREPETHAQVVSVVSMLFVAGQETDVDWLRGGKWPWRHAHHPCGGWLCHRQLHQIHTSGRP